MSREKKETQKQRGCVGFIRREAWNRERTKGGERRSGEEISDGGKEIRERVSRNINFEKLFSSSVRISPRVYSNQKNIYSKKLRARIQRDPRLNCSWDACSQLQIGFYSFLVILNNIVELITTFERLRLFFEKELISSETNCYMNNESYRMNISSKYR